MSDFGEGIIERLNINSNLKNPNNPVRKILDYGVGGWLDNFYDNELAENVFLDSAAGKWLDVHGRQLNVPRKLEEEDDKYRGRIVYESMGHLTTNYLKDVYGVELYSYTDAFIGGENILLSNNPHFCNEGFLGIADSDTKAVLNKKFLLDKNFYWIDEEEWVEHIMDINGHNIVRNYSYIYSLQNLENGFKDNTDITKVGLTLPKAINCQFLFRGCSNLTDAKLNLQNATNCWGLFAFCSNLNNVSITAPNIEQGNYAFEYCTSLTKVNLSLGDDIGYTSLQYMFKRCTGLTDAKLNIRGDLSMQYLFTGCTNLTNITLNISFTQNYRDFLENCPNLKKININLGTSSSTTKNAIKNYILGLNLQYLEELIIDGEEVEL